MKEFDLDKISAANAGDYIVRGPKGDFERDWEQA